MLSPHVNELKTFNVESLKECFTPSSHLFSYYRIMCLVKRNLMQVNTTPKEFMNILEISPSP